MLILLSQVDEKILGVCMWRGILWYMTHTGHTDISGPWAGHFVADKNAKMWIITILAHETKNKMASLSYICELGT